MAAGRRAPGDRFDGHLRLRPHVEHPFFQPEAGYRRIDRTGIDQRLQRQDRRGRVASGRGHRLRTADRRPVDLWNAVDEPAEGIVPAADGTAGAVGQFVARSQGQPVYGKGCARQRAALASVAAHMRIQSSGTSGLGTTAQPASRTAQ